MKCWNFIGAARSGGNGVNNAASSGSRISCHWLNSRGQRRAEQVHAAGQERANRGDQHQRLSDLNTQRREADHDKHQADQNDEQSTVLNSLDGFLERVAQRGRVHPISEHAQGQAVGEPDESFQPRAAKS
jgi:hypothetical protein